MVSIKRKAPPASQGTNKAVRASAASTPRASTPGSTDADDALVSDALDESGDTLAVSDEMNSMISDNVDRFGIGAFPYNLPPGIVDSASRYFQPQHRKDFTSMPLKPDHDARPLWVDGWGKLTLESYHPLARPVQDLLTTISEPVSRPTFMHEYRITPHSLYAAVSVGLEPRDIISSLDRFSKTDIPPNLVEYIRHCGKSYGKVKLVLRRNRYFVETADPVVMQLLLKDPEISACRVHGEEEVTLSAPTVSGLVIAGTKEAAGLAQARGLDTRVETPAMAQAKLESQASAALAAEDSGDEADDADGTGRNSVFAFQISDDKVSAITQRCLALHYPALEEYDFRNDFANANLEIDLRPAAQIRPYQEQSLSKMFGNGRAKSGIIVLPCGAGKTLVGITAACTIKKGVVILATSNMSVLQWRNEFLKWSNISPDDIAVFSSDNKSTFSGNTGIIITTYSMVTNTRERAHESAKMIKFLQSREWGLMLLDEVHVVPAQMFRRVIGNIKAHSKLGLTATLLREDDKIEDLNFLIGPKLYEANWMELSRQGYIARVQCAEVWCPMTTEFFEEYMRANVRSRSIFVAMNPTKFQACQYLIKYHENRGDKIIVFSDNVYALEAYAKRLMKPFLYGGTSNTERQQILDYFQHSPQCSTLFLSKIGDTSLDLPEATVLIQISAQYGSRRQEAQRLGRILRAKRRNEDGFNAFFYSLVSKDTTEMAFSAKRQAFLVDQGYAFKVITHLKGIENMPDLAFASSHDRRELLQKILVEVESKSWRDEEDKESASLLADSNMFYGPDGKPLRKAARNKKPARRTAGTLRELSGGQDMAYIEQNKSANKQIRGKKAPQNSFFKAIARENERRRKME
ncbi:DNA repair helicase RAD25 [Sporothrix curviconia]|uniref:DNA 3'-5' helicase n=1 Tax=Sporothrix curviconia TaxID=1260050 RepID=A0ABP0BET5_9PEZI